MARTPHQSETSGVPSQSWATQSLNDTPAIPLDEWLQTRDLTAAIRQILNSEGTSERRIERLEPLIREEIQRRLLKIGVSFKFIFEINDSIKETSSEISFRTDQTRESYNHPQDGLRKAWESIIDDSIDSFIVDLCGLNHEKIDNFINYALEYGNLSDFVHKLEERLRKDGWGEDVASKIAQVATSQFREKADRSPHPGDATNFAVELAAATASAVRTSLGAEFNQSAQVPTSAETRWVDRDPNQFPTAESFLRHYFGSRLGIEGDLTQGALAKIDSRLMAALDAEFTGKRRAELRRLLPTTKERNDALLLERYGYLPEGDDRKKKVTVLARHKR